MFKWLFHILIFATISGKYQNKEKSLKCQRKLGLRTIMTQFRMRTGNRMRICNPPPPSPVFVACNILMSCLSHHPFDWAFDTPSVKNMEDSVWFNLFSELYYSVYLSEGIMFRVRNDICVSFLHPHAWSTCDPKFDHFFYKYVTCTCTCNLHKY